MKQTFTKRQKAGQFFVVLLPIFVTQIALMAPGFFNTVMAGHISGEDLAGVAVGANIFFPCYGSVLVVISGLTPVISQLHGAGGKEKIIRRIVQQGFFWALALATLFLTVGYLGTPQLIKILSLDPHVEDVMVGYMMALSCGVPWIFLAGVLRNVLDAHGFTQLTMGITICAVPVNIFLNYVFMYGAFGISAFGGVGAGIGSAITYFLIFLLNVLVVANKEPFRSYHLFKNLPKPDFKEWKKQLSIGLPIGATSFCEQSIFGVVGLFMTAYGTVIVAAHQATMNFITIVYMFPLSVGMALTILVGFEVGAKRYEDAKEYIFLGRILTMLVVFCFAGILIQCMDWIAGIYTTDSEIHKWIYVLLIYAIAMNVLDSINAPLQGALRGYKDVKVTLYLAILSFWIIGIPAGYFAAHYMNLGVQGYWIGLNLGILVGAICLAVRLRIVERANQI